ncbi:hypothetical protein M427DRAFT_55745 [Gonapodya prolifera JEL478]|uniref:Uncharacterized protein n=1 Tax=Gonapodya prolifera (strain JEL478) TaxID=1344416 RepID=A0A139AHP0_GONPJ|nr:hypothetical protein M427DRAFT_55745 [Gonapodya prolifera JEL478]|eukprot:KXS16317.1 hypothetical protein M427DRAFT_55745 [Gonapodya prolifera JEL478]
MTPQYSQQQMPYPYQQQQPGSPMTPQQGMYAQPQPMFMPGSPPGAPPGQYQ